MTPKQIELVTAAIQGEIDRRIAEVSTKGLAVGGQRGQAETIDQLFESIKGYVRRNIDPLHSRVKELESPRTRTMMFKGGWDPSQVYEAGAVVQRQSATWVCLVETREQPGQSSHWRRIGSSE